MTTHKNRALAPLAAAVLSVSLIGCTHEELTRQGPSFALIDPSQRHPILVSQKPSNLTVHVPKGSSGLSPKSRADVLDFAQKYRDSGDSRLIISVPSGSGNEVPAMHAAQQVRGLLSDQGFTESMVAVEPFDASHDSAPPIRVSYMRYVAEGPECGHWPSNVAYEPQNLPMANTGCANQRNLASMVSNPADLLGPRTMTQRAGERRDVVWEKYQKGETTASSKNEDSRVSTRAQGN